MVDLLQQDLEEDAWTGVRPRGLGLAAPRGWQLLQGEGEGVGQIWEQRQSRDEGRSGESCSEKDETVR